jgi:hypothetical protein
MKNSSKKKHQEICEILEEHARAIKSRKLVVYLIDECHLLWGDVCGYLWGRRNERIEIPLVNQREKQTYYGAVNYLTFTVCSARICNGKF